MDAIEIIFTVLLVLWAVGGAGSPPANRRRAKKRG